ncbi:putative Prosaposin [Hypsibius exemplaris]|uniref:Prosaposin n=1 Tax=Hypsibius exemplaris TaxID=2072580 RepID=A0A1W0WDJ8_HYPEX|nr:putative Prosaposin [Hypsibius exemplaris]
MGFLILIPLLLIGVVSADRLAVSSMSGSSSSSRGRLLGGNSCTWGPSYWCGHVRNARQCNAVDHCTQAVWLKQSEPVDASAECRWCDDLMDDVRDLVERTNASKTALRGYLKDGCRRHPTAGNRETCLDNTASYIVEVKQMLKAGVPDRTICKAIGYCSVPSQQVAKPKPEIAARNYCLDCFNFFEDAKELYLGNYTEDEYKAMLLQQCEQASTYPAITELCKMVIEQYWPQIYSRLEMFFDPEQVCYQISMCNDSSSSPKKDFGVPWSTLASSRSRGSSQPQQLPINRMLLNFDRASRSQQSAAVSKPRTKNAKGEWTDAECIVCEFVMSYLDRMLEDNYTEASIQSALDRVCQTMPKTVRDQCQGFVDQYAPAILVILGNELDPAQVCQGLQLCNGEQKTAGKCGGGQATCEGCTEVFQAIKTLFESYEESNRIAELVKSACTGFPAGKIRQQCELAVTTYAPYVMQIAAQLMQPEGVCHAFKMCTA